MALTLFLLASLLAVPSQAALRKFNLTMTRGYAAPDCNKRPVILVNGQFMGPTIRVNTGDDVEILVTNRLIGEELSIHWHGLFQKGTPWMDGPAFITQCPILSGGNSFTYRFSAENQVGTFWWHAHNSVLRTEGVMGAFIIDGGAGCEQEPYVNQYNEEILISLTDWYHLPTSSIITGLDTPGQFTFPGNGNSILINGKGQARNYQNSSTVFSCVPTNCTDCPREVITVEQGKRYRLRIINMAALGFFNFAIEGHSFTVVEADGTPTKPVVVQSLDLSAGQRYSVILNADQPKADYWMTVQTRWRASPFTLNPSGTAVLHYAVPNSPANPTPTTPIPDSSTRPLFDFLNKLQTLPSVAQPIPRTATKTITLKVTQQYYPVNQSAGGQFRWPLSGTPYSLPSTPALWLSYLGRTNRLSKESKMISLNRNDVVDIIVQNGAAANGVCENHPWHLHGHGMWVIGAGNGTYPNNPTLSWTYNSDFSPIFRDTVSLTPSQFISGTPTGPQNAGLDCGWLKLRFRADNPGTWFFHCHVEWHMHMGMGVVFETAPTRIPDPPSDFPPCGIVPFSTEGY